MVEYEIVLVHLLAGDIAFDVFTAAKRLCFSIAHIKIWLVFILIKTYQRDL